MFLQPPPAGSNKRRKLDEIVMGLSANKLQQSDVVGANNSSSGESRISNAGTGSGSLSEAPTKKPSASPSPNFSANLLTKTSSASASQLLSRTLSSSVGKASLDLSSYFSNVEQQSLLLKQQQQLFHHQQQQVQSAHKVSLPGTAASLAGQRNKAYEAMLADFNKVNDISAKMNNAYTSHDAKVS